MANEELSQRGYLKPEGLTGDAFGPYERLNLGATSIAELIACGLDASATNTVPFPFSHYSPPAKPSIAKPDTLFLDRRSGTPVPVANIEWKKPTNFDSAKKREKAKEQALFTAAALGLKFALATDGKTFVYIDVPQSLNDGQVRLLEEDRELTPGVLEDLQHGSEGEAKNPTQLAQTIWQIIGKPRRRSQNNVY